MGNAAKLGYSVTHRINVLLPPTLRYGDGDAQPGEYSNSNLQWAETDSNPKGIGQRLAKNLTLGLDIDPSEGFERAILPKELLFPGKVVIESKGKAEENARKAYSTDSDLILWSDGSRLETGAVGAGIAWEIGQKWYDRGRPLGNTKEVFDAELYGIRDALEVAIRGGTPLGDLASSNTRSQEL